MKKKINLLMLLGINFYYNQYIPPDIGIPLYLKKFGHKISRAVSCNNKKQYNTYNNIIIYKIININNVPKTISKVINIYLRLLQLYKNIEINKYNVIIVRRNVIDGIFAIFIKKIKKIPVVILIENPLIQSLETHKFYRKNYFEGHILSKIKFYFMYYVLTKCDSIIAISKGIKNDLIAYGFDPNKIFIMPEGVDQNLFNMRARKYEK